MSGTRTRRWAGAGLRIASALALAATVLGFGPATEVGTAAAGVGVHADASTGTTKCVPSGDSGTGTTCTGTFGGDTAWDWFLGGTDANGNPIGAMTGVAPTVTVDQTTGLTNQIVHVSWSNFTPSMTDGLSPGYRQGHEYYGVGIFQCKGMTPQVLTSDCNDLMIGTPAPGAPPTGVESYTLSGSSTQVTDCTAVPTDTTCGTGFADMQIQTSAQNSSLGCDATHPCSLVVLPFWGGNTFTQPATCEDHSGDLANNDALDGNNPWYSPCTWADRITVPLTFAPTPGQACNTTNYTFSAQGSPLLERVMGLWQPGWCTGAQNSSKVVLNYDSTVNEYQATTAFLNSGGSKLSSATDVALVTDPPDSQQTSASSRTFTFAPIATTAITIAFYVDNQNTQEPITNIKLNARLVAKLLTESYALSFGQCAANQTTGETDLCDTAVKGNPVSLFADPEFYALNPEYNESEFTTETNPQGNSGDFLPIVMGGNSQLTYELTRWVESDPTARGFLQGLTDPWGMHVNSYYLQGLSETYPITQFQVLDPGFRGQPTDTYMSTMQVAWNPVTGLDNVASDLAGWTASGLQFAASCSGGVNAQPPCVGGNPVNAKDGVDPFPQRALFAIMDSGTAAAYRFPMAQIVVDKAGDAVSPSIDSMNAAVAAMKTNPDGITQYDSYPSTSTDAYPLTEVQYAMVPTCGLTSTKASAISTFLQDVVSSQVYGVGVGQIPKFGGYAALTDAQEKQTLNAAANVSTQTCKGSNPDTSVGGHIPSGSSGAGLGSGTGNGNGGTGGNGNNSPGNSPTASPTGRATASASPSASATPIGLGDKAADSSSDIKYILPLALAVGALLAIGGPLAYGYGTTGGFRLRWPRRRRPGTQGPDGSGDPDGGADV